MTSLMIGKVYAVVVTYKPDVDLLRDLLSALCPQVAGVMVVDNTPACDQRVTSVCSEPDFSCIRLMRLGSNQGLARALNVGMTAAARAGASHFLLSDQDSLPASDMVTVLLREERRLKARGHSVAAVGPTYTERYTGMTFPFKVHWPGRFFYGHQKVDATCPVVEALTLITSGTLMSVEAFAAIGPMREDFFIDSVDIEWCLRARAVGYSLHGIGAATMYHTMGERVLRVWYFGWHRGNAYSPTRVYYCNRNFMALCRMSMIPWRWKLLHGWYNLGFIYTQVGFGYQRLSCLKMALRGLWDGWKGRMGPWYG